MSKIPKNSAKNLISWLIFGSFWITPSHVLLVVPQFLCQMRGLTELHNRGKFHLYSICGFEVKKFEMFLWQWSIHEMAYFWAFLGPNSPKYGPILLKFARQLLFRESNALAQEFFKNSNFYRNRTSPKFALFLVFVRLWGCFSPWRRLKSSKLEIWKTKLCHCAIQKSQNQGPILSQLFRKNMITFCPILVVFWWKKGRGHTLKARNQNLT